MSPFNSKVTWARPLLGGASLRQFVVPTRRGDGEKRWWEVGRIWSRCARGDSQLGMAWGWLTNQSGHYEATSNRQAILGRAARDLPLAPVHRCHQWCRLLCAQNAMSRTAGRSVARSRATEKQQTFGAFVSERQRGAGGWRNRKRGRDGEAHLRVMVESYRSMHGRRCHEARLRVWHRCALHLMPSTLP